MPTPSFPKLLLAAAPVGLGLTAPLLAQQDVLPPIPKGTISIGLNPIATGMGAPDYAIAPPGDTSRLFVIEQKVLLRVVQNGALLAGNGLDIQSRLAMNTASA